MSAIAGKKKQKKIKAPRLMKTQPIAGVNFLLLRDIETVMRDGVILRGDLYLPAHDGKVESKKYPCVLIRTPYNKEADKSTSWHPGQFFVVQDYCCFVQDCRGRFKSDGNFTKYTNEGEDGYDTVEWVAQQPWCNGNVCTYGVSYLCHVQTSMALHRPPHLTAMFCIAGGFWNAHSSGVRQGGAYEARQWVWGIKKAQDIKDPLVQRAMKKVDDNIEGWFLRFPFKRGNSPLSPAPQYEKYLFKQASNADYSDYWKQIGYNTEEFQDDFADVPTVYLSGWYDIYARSTVEFFTNLRNKKKGPLYLVMGPWAHTTLGTSRAGEVDFGNNARIMGNLAQSDYHLAQAFFDQFCESPSDITTDEDEAEEKEEGLESEKTGNNPNNPYSSRLPVSYFRMGGGDGMQRSGFMYHSGVWLECSQWPPLGVHSRALFFKRQKLSKRNNPFPNRGSTPRASRTNPLAQSVGGVSSAEAYEEWLPPKVSDLPDLAKKHVAHPPPEEVSDNSMSCSSFQYDPRQPVPSIGGNVFPHKRILMAGPYNQVETPAHFLCQPPYLPLSSRSDVLVFRSEALEYDIEVSGSPKVILYISSSCRDTDFTAKLIDEYPPNASYPEGYAMNITHGIIRCRYRNGRDTEKLMTPTHIYQVEIEMYPTSNLFAVGHHIRVDISSSNYPHFDLNLNNGGDYYNTRIMKADNTVYHTTEYPSRIELPIMQRRPTVTLREQVCPHPEAVLQSFLHPHHHHS